MKSAWTSVRAFAVVVAMAVFGGVLSALAILAAIGKGDKELGLLAAGALIAFIAGIRDAYFSAPTGASGPHAPTT